MMEGVITFFSSQQVMKAEKLLKTNGHEVILIPGPREISPNCGVALCFDYSSKDIIRELLDLKKLVYEKIHLFPEAKKISKWL